MHWAILLPKINPFNWKHGEFIFTLHHLTNIHRKSNLIFNQDLEDTADNGEQVVDQDKNVPHVYKLQFVRERKRRNRMMSFEEFYRLLNSNDEQS